MTARSLSLLALTGALWILPSIGTQGMGTIGQSVVHTDAVLIDTMPLDRAASTAVMIHADTVVEAALGF